MNDNNHFKTRLNKLEKRVQTIERELSIETSSIAAETKEEKFETISDPRGSKPLTPDYLTSFFTWLKEDWLMKLGAALLILALVWFVTYAFANNWIGPIGRISLGIAAGAAILGFGHYIIPKKRVPGEVLVVTGMTMLILTIFAGKFFYEFFSSPLALGMMTLIMALAATISILRKSKPVAVITVIASGLVPILIGGFESANSLLLLGYLLIVDIGVLIIVSARSWRSLIILSLIITGIYATGAFDYLEYKNHAAVWIFMGIFYFLFLLTNFAAIWKSKVTKTSDLFVAGLNSLIILGWISFYTPDHWQSIILSGLAVLSIGLVALMLKHLDHLKKNVFIYGGAALAFIIAATAFELKEYDAALIIAFSIEILLATYFTQKFIKDSKAASAISLLQAIPIVLLMTNGAFEYSSWKGVSILNEHSIALIIVILSLFTTAYFFASTIYKTLLTHATVASILAILLIWFASFNLISNFYTARGVALIIYTIVGVILLFSSYKDDLKYLRIGSSILLGGVVLRLFIVEFWEMPIAGKVITSFLVGALLITTAFVNKKLLSKK